MSIFTSKSAEKAPPPAPAVIPAWADTPAMQALCRVAPRWAEIRTKQGELSARKEALYAELRPLNRRLSARGEFNSWVVASEAADRARAAAAPPLKEIRASPQAAALLGPLTPAPRAPPAPLTRAKSSDRARMDEIVAELAVIDEAFELLDPPVSGGGRGQMEKLYLEGCRKFCDEVRPEYDALAAKFCAALVALGEATVEYNAFVRETLRGIAWESLRPIRVSQLLGDPLDPSSELRQLLALAAERRHFDPADLPAAWPGK